MSDRECMFRKITVTDAADAGGAFFRDERFIQLDCGREFVVKENKKRT